MTYITCLCVYIPIKKILRPYFTDEEIEAQRKAVLGQAHTETSWGKRRAEKVEGRGMTLRIQPDLGEEPRSHLQARIRVQSARMHILASSLRACRGSFWYRRKSE